MKVKVKVKVVVVVVVEVKLEVEVEVENAPYLPGRGGADAGSPEPPPLLLTGLPPIPIPGVTRKQHNP